MNPDYTMIAQQASHRCEYCKAPEVIFNFPFEVDHIVPLSRQGSNDEANLALACRSCNLQKGNRISEISSGSNTEVRFFHPRADGEVVRRQSASNSQRITAVLSAPTHCWAALLHDANWVSTNR